MNSTLETEILQNLRRNRAWIPNTAEPAALDPVTEYYREVLNATRELDPLEIAMAKYLTAFYEKTLKDREAAGEKEAAKGRKKR